MSLENQGYFTSEEILASEDLYHVQELDIIPYQLTPDEIDWLNFVYNRYSIAGYLYSVMDSNNVAFIDPIDISKALDDDCNGFGKAVMLSDDTALQRVIFWIYQESEEE